MLSNDPNLIFILGMDREKVAAAIAFKQRDVIPYLDSIARDSQESEPENSQLMKKLDYGYAFLEKFVQLSFSVPKPSKKTLEKFLEEFSADKQQNPQETTTKTTERPELAIFPLIKKEPTSEDITKLVKEFANFFDHNPRNLKQYLNALKLRTYITYYSVGVLFEERNSLTVEELGKFTAIIVKYPRLLPHLEDNNKLLDRLETYARFQCSQANDEKIQIAKDWVDNNPKLKGLLCNGDSLADNKGIKKLLEVSSELELDPRYFKLRQFLEEGKWREADEETATVMLQVVNKQQGFDRDSIEKFPCEDLRIIDRLWAKYSITNDYPKGKFGFSVQKEIYESLGGTKEYNDKVMDEFYGRVGWERKNELVIYDDLTWKLEEAPRAHLPSFRYFLFSRTTACNL